MVRASVEEKEVQRLYGRFASLDVDESNALTRDELLGAEEVRPTAATCLHWFTCLRQFVVYASPYSLCQLSRVRGVCS